VDNLLDTPDAPDDSARLAREAVARLTELVRQNPGVLSYQIKLRGWLHELAHPTRYKGENDDALLLP